ncbi:MAG: hypothetical protein HQL66_06435 [Magnetococcales bacterium]|nr:hypothetical protein [Magnetococcales bacterium]
MPNTVELLTPDQLATLVGKSYSVQSLGGGKASVTPLAPATGSTTVPAKITLKGVEIEGLRAAKAAAAQQATAPKAAAGAQTLVAAKLPVVEIEGAGKTVGATPTKILSLETRGVMPAGNKGVIDLRGGEAKIATAKIAPTAPAKSAPVAAKMQTVALTQPTDTTGATTAGSGIAVGSTLLKGSGLGLGLSFWGPLLLAGVATAVVGIGVYNYMQRKQQAPAA